MTALIVVGVLVFLLLVFFVIYNSMVGKKNAVEQAFSSIDVMLKKRYDLIPNLVQTAKGYMKHEASTLENIAGLRARAMGGNIAPDEAVALNNQISRAIGGIMVAVEAYPELRANEQFLQIQRALNEVEEQLSAARRAYNAAVTDFNNAVEMVPTNIVAGMMGYRVRKLFETEEATRKNVDVGALLNT